MLQPLQVQKSTCCWMPTKYFILMSALISLIPTIHWIVQTTQQTTTEGPEAAIFFAIIPTFLLLTLCSKSRCLSIFSTILLIIEIIACTIMAVTMAWYAIFFHSLANIFGLNSFLGIALGIGTFWIWIIIGIVIGKIILDIVTCSQLQKLQNFNNEEQEGHIQHIIYK